MTRQRVASPRGYAAGRDIRIGNVHVYMQAAAAPPAKHKATHEHAEVLALMDGLPERSLVLDFMRREFDTTRVLDVDGHDLFRLRRYVETVREKGRVK